jgi:hypothetical protein
MRLPEIPNLPQSPADGYARLFRQSVFDALKAIGQKVNQMADGRIAGADLVSTAAPTTGTFKQGDFVRNSTPTELGVVTAKYVIIGWICVTGGTPGTFYDCRVLTGN